VPAVLAREISGASGWQSAEGGGVDAHERRDLPEPAPFRPQEPTPPNPATVVWTRPPLRRTSDRLVLKTTSRAENRSVIPTAIRRRRDHRLPHAGRDASALGPCWLSRRTRRQSMMSTLWRTLSPRTAGSLRGERRVVQCREFPWRTSNPDGECRWRRRPEKSVSVGELPTCRIRKGCHPRKLPKSRGIKTVSFLPKRFRRQRRRKKPPTQWLARILTK
jgi:hypothetical protein